MNIIKLPYQFSPRDYQKRCLDAFFKEHYRKMCLVWHRRAGKTNLSLNIINAASQMRVGAYYYFFPQFNQARRSLWENRGNNGIRFIDQIPKELIAKVNNTEMSVTYKNGSILRLMGSDNYDKMMGPNPLGIVYDEYSLQNPVARDYLLPILIENKGWEILIFTPRGGNFAYTLYNNVKNSPDWYTELLTIEDTKLPGIKEAAEKLVETGEWSQDKYEQEFYCSFEAAVHGAYFSKQLKKAEEDKRIYDFSIDTSIPVNTAWDIGYRDATAIWFYQQTREAIKAIGYYENHGKDIKHYINYLHDFREKQGIVYEHHYAPHDSKKHDWTTGKTILEFARDLGLKFEPIPRINKKSSHIEMGRANFSRMHFHKTNCKRGLDCLREYHADYNEAMGIYSVDPVHNWASHGADAYLYLSQAAKINPNQQKFQVLHNRVGMNRDDF